MKNKKMRNKYQIFFQQMCVFFNEKYKLLKMQGNIPLHITSLVQRIFKNYCPKQLLFDQRKPEIMEQFRKFQNPSNKSLLVNYLTSDLNLTQSIANSICSEFYNSSKIKTPDQKINIQDLEQILKQVQADLSYLQKDSFEYIMKAILLNQLKQYFPSIQKFQLKMNISQFKQKMTQYKFDEIIIKQFQNAVKLKDFSKQRIESFFRVSKTIDVLNLAEIRRYKNNSELDKLKDKNVLMLIGKSGVGKTTFLFTSMGIELRATLKDQFQPVDPSLVGNSKISAKCVSQTREARGQILNKKFARSEQVYSIDTAGFQDNRSSEIDILNNLSTLKVVEVINSARFLVFISGRNLGTKGDPLKQFARTLSHYFQKYDDVQDSIKFILTQFDEDTFQYFKHMIESILISLQFPKDSQTMQDKANKNFNNFFIHLKEQIQDKKIIRFHPLNSDLKQVFKQILKVNVLQKPSQHIYTSYSVAAVSKIRQKGKHLQKMIELSFKKGQYSLTQFYLSELQYLETLNPKKKILVQAHQKQKKWIEDSLNQIPKSYQNQLTKFFKNFDKDNLQQANIIKMNIQKFDMSYIEKSPKTQIEQIKNRKIEQIKQFFSSGLKGKKVNSYFLACLYFLQVEDSVLYKKITQGIKQKQLENRTQLQNQLALKLPSQQTLKTLVDQYINQFRCDETTQQNKFQVRYVQLQSMVQNILQTEYINNQQLLKIAYDKILDQRTIKKIIEFIKKLDIISSVHFKFSSIVKNYNQKLLKELKNILCFYIAENNKFVMEKQTDNFQKLTLYQQNFQTLMNIEQIKGQFQIALLNFKSGVIDVLRKTLKTLEDLKESIYKQMSSYSKQKLDSDAQTIEPIKLKKILQEILNCSNFLQRVGKQNSQKNKIVKQIVAQAQDSILDFLQNIKSKAMNYQVIDFKIPKRLLIAFVIIGEFNSLRINKDWIQKVNSIKEIITQKVNQPLKNQIKKKQLKQLKKKSDKIAVNSVHQYKKVYKLLCYYKKFNQIMDQIQDKKGRQIQKIAKFRQNQELSNLIDTYFNNTKEQSRYLQENIKKIGQFKCNQSKEKKIEEFVQYINTYYIIENICKTFGSQIQIIGTFIEEDLSRSNVKILIERQLQRLRIKVSESEQYFIGKQLNELQQTYNFYNSIFKESREKSNQGTYLQNQNKYNQIMVKIKEHRQRIGQSFSSILESLKQQLSQKEIGLRMSDIKLLAQSVGQAPGRLDQLKRFLNKVAQSFYQRLRAYIDSDKQKTPEQMIFFIDTKNEFEKVLKQITNVIANVPFNVDKYQFDGICNDYFEVIYQEYLSLVNLAKQMKTIQRRPIRSLESKQNKVYNLIPHLYQSFLKDKKIKSKYLKKELQNFIQIHQKHAEETYFDQNTFIIDKHFHQFYKNTSASRKEELNLKVFSYEKNCQKQLNRLFAQDRGKLSKKIEEIQSTINLLPIILRQNLSGLIEDFQQKVKIQKNQTLNKAVQLKKNNQVKDIITLALQKTKNNDQKAVKDITQIFVECLQTQKNTFAIKKSFQMSQIIKKLQFFKNDKNLKVLENQIPEIKLKIKEYQEDFHINMKTKVVKVKNQVKNIILKFEQQININTYKYNIIKNQTDCDSSIKEITGLVDVVSRNQTIFTNEFQDNIIQTFQQLLETKIKQYEKTNQIMEQFCERIVESSKGQFDQMLFRSQLGKSSIQIYLMEKFDESFSKIATQKLKKSRQELKKIKDSSSLKKNIQKIVFHAQSMYRKINQFNVVSIQIKKADASDIKKIFLNQQNMCKNLQKLIPAFQNEIIKINQNFKEIIKTNIENQIKTLAIEVEQSVSKSFEDLQYEGQQEYFYLKNLSQVINETSFQLFSIQKGTEHKINKKTSQKIDETKKKINQINSFESKKYIQELMQKIEDVKKQKPEKLKNIKDLGNVKFQNFKKQQEIKLQNSINNIDPNCADKAQEQKKLKINFDGQILSKQTDINTQNEVLIKKINSQTDSKLLQLESILGQFFQQKFLKPLILLRKNSSIFQPKETVQFIKDKFQKLQKESKIGKKIIKQVFNVLNNNQNNYAQMLKNQGQPFKRLTKIKFINQTKNQGIQWLKQNIPEIKKKQSAKQDIIKYFKMYSQCKDQIIKIYEQASLEIQAIRQAKMEQAKIQIIQNTLALANTLENGLRSGKNTLTDSKVKLLAHIFSIWIIQASYLDEDDKLEFMYEPHPAQICALFFLLDIVSPKQKSKTIQNCLVQVPTGQGKSVVLAGLSSYFALLGYQVYEACYSKYLSQRDFKQFQKLFQALRITNKIKYNIFSQVCKQLLNQNSEQTFASKVSSIILKSQSNNNGIFSNVINKIKGVFNEESKNDKKINKVKKILIIDEADVFLNRSFIGEVYSPALNLNSPHIQNLLQYIWNARNREIKPEEVFQTNQYKKLISQFSQLSQLLQNQVHGMINGVKNFGQDSYTVKNDKIFYRQNDGLSSSIHHGYKTVFSYFHEHHVKKEISFNSYLKNCVINLIFAHLSYTKLPSYFQHILGVTGTLNTMNSSQKNLLKTQYKVQKTVTMPSIYGIQSKRIVKFYKVNKLKCYIAFVNQIQRQHKKGRPVIVFFKNKNQLNEFFSSSQFNKFKANTCKITYQNNSQQRDFRIQSATFQNKITLLTDDFSRGTDFKFNMKQKLNHEGLHVIQTFLPASQSDYVQLIGRTARQGKNGSATIFQIVNQEDQVFQKEEELNNAIAVQMIKQTEEQYWKRESADIDRKIKEANTLHDETVKLYTKASSNKEIIKKIYTWNEQPVIKNIMIKTIIAVDATGSMSAVFPKVKQTLKLSFPRLYDVLNTKGGNGAFQLKVIVYRNYNSNFSQIIQASNFQNKPNILIDFVSSVNVSGGWGNQAIQVCFQAINSIQKVHQVIIIGDAASNTPNQTIEKRKSKKWDENGFSQTNITKQTDLLIKKGVPVHSYHIAADTYFQDLSKKTGGKSSKFNVNSNNAAEQLTNFVSMIILEKMEKQGNGDGSLVRYYQQKYIQKKSSYV